MATTFARYSLPGGRWLKVLSEEAANSSNKTFTVPDGVAWEPVNVRVELTTTATAGTRRPDILHLDDANDLVAVLGVGATQAASLTRILNFFPKAVVKAPSATADGTEVLAPTMLPAGHILQVIDSAAVDAAADDMVVQITVIEHVCSNKATGAA